MKTAEEWWNTPLGPQEGDTYPECKCRWIKQIQLDAWKQGMADAQTIVNTLKNPYDPKWADKHYGVSWMREKCSVAILERANDRKSI